jgi:hypothetical protein
MHTLDFILLFEMRRQSKPAALLGQLSLVSFGSHFGGSGAGGSPT